MSLPTDFKGTALSVCVCPIDGTKLIFQKKRCFNPSRSDHCTLPAAIIHRHQIKYIYSILGRWTAALDQRFTRQWICGHYRTRRPWCSTFLYEPPAGVRLSHSHYLHLFLSARRGKFFTVGCIWLPAKCSRSYAPATTHKEEPIFNGVGTYEMPAYPASSRESYFSSVRFDSNFSRRGGLFSL